MTRRKQQPCYMTCLTMEAIISASSFGLLSIGECPELIDFISALASSPNIC